MRMASCCCRLCWRDPLRPEQALFQLPECLDEGGHAAGGLPLGPRQPGAEGHLQPADPQRAREQEAREGDGEGVHPAVPGAAWHRVHGRLL
ncbi:importin 13, partial [Chelydra serpentina]